MELMYNIIVIIYFKYFPGRKKMARILVSMPDEFLNKVDGLASEEQRTRSELVREALRSYIKRSKIANPQKASENAKILDELLD